MKVKHIILAISVLSLTLGSACKKKTDDPGTNNTGKPADITGKTNQQVFMIQKWTIKSWRDSSLNGDFGALENCNKDDKYEFKTTTSYQLNRGTSKCDPSEDLTQNFSWSMASPTSDKVTVFGYTYDIVRVSGESIELRRYFPVTGGMATQIIVLYWTT